MTDYLQVTVPIEEEEEFLHIYGDFHFPRLGMMCNVISCSSMSFFSTYAQYMEHFIKSHRSYINLYKCVSCGRIFQKKNKRSHLNAHSSVRSKFEFVKKPNPNYLAPGDCRLALPPRQKPSNINDNELRNYKRVSVASKRQEYKTYMARRQSSAQILEEFESQSI